MPHHPDGHRVPHKDELDPALLARVAGLIGDAPHPRDLLIEHLHILQDAFGFLPAAALTALAHRMGLSAAEVFDTATFYAHFRVVSEGEQPPATAPIRICTSLVCGGLHGGEAVAQSVEEHIAEQGRVVRSPCQGRCSEGVSALVGWRPVTHSDPAKILAAVAAGHTEPDPLPLPEMSFGHLRRCHAGELNREAVLQTLDDAGLKGMGGAGFPAGRKWRSLLTEPQPRLMAVNIDEGEPGTFKDRYYLEHHLERVLEGILIAAWVIEAKTVYLYIRDAYTAHRLLLAEALQRLQTDPPFPVPELHLRRGAGAYVCGEETALVESLEGKRGMPRQRPPRIGEVGLFGRPTLVHNLETLAWVPEILRKGAAWFAEQGRRGRSGLRTFSLSGRVARPGVYVAPLGITLRELIEEYGGGMAPGHALRGFCPCGASGGLLPARAADTPLDFDTLQPLGSFLGSASIVVFSQADDPYQLALNALRFLRDESCGQCTPCRDGTYESTLLLEKGERDATVWEPLFEVMVEGSICGLGKSAPNPIRSLLHYFPEALPR